MIAIVDYGMGNFSSIENMIRKVGGNSLVTDVLTDLSDLSGIILPGVGAFDHAVSRLSRLGMIEDIRHFVLEKKIPFLGICLGMQLLFDSSEEGDLPGLGIIHGKVQRFSGKEFSSGELKVPHMGWNNVSVLPDCTLLGGLGVDPRFYFVHSYHVVCKNPDDTAAISNYGGDFTCAIERENIFAVQFHPEKSHRFGMKVFDNFLKITAC